MYVLHVSNLAIDQPYRTELRERHTRSGTLRVLGSFQSVCYTIGLDANIACNLLPAGLTLSGLTVSGTPLENGNFCPLFKTTDSASGSLTLTNYVFFAGVQPARSASIITTRFYITINQSFTVFSSMPAVRVHISGARLAVLLPPGMTLSSAGVLNGTQISFA